MKRLAQLFTLVAIFLIPFYIFRFSFFGMPTNIFEIAVFISFVAALSLIISTHEKPDFGSIWLYLFLLTALVSTVLSPDKREALGILKGWFIAPAFLYFSVINLFSRKDLLKLAIPVAASLCLVTIWGLLQDFGIVKLLFYQIGDPGLAQYLSKDNFRIFGPFESPNYLAMFIVPMFFLSLPVILLAKKKAVQWILYGVVAFSIYDLWLTGSRAGLVAFGASLLSVVALQTFWEADKKKRLKNIILGLIFIFSATFLYFDADMSSSRTGSDSSRKEIWAYSIDMVKDSPIYGIGLGGFYDRINSLSTNNQEFRVTTLPYALHPHNVFLALWINLGLIGLFAFIMIMYDFAKNALADRKIRAFGLLYAVAMVAILIHGLFDTTYFKNDLSSIFWLILAFGYLLTRGAQQDEKVS